MFFKKKINQINHEIHEDIREAIISGSEKRLIRILDSFENPNIVTDINCNVLHIAVNFGLSWPIGTILKFGVDIDFKGGYGNCSPFFSAVDFKKYDVALTLLMAGADVNTRNGIGSSPIIRAARNSAPLTVMEDLLNYGADINASYDFYKSDADMVRDYRLNILKRRCSREFDGVRFIKSIKNEISINKAMRGDEMVPEFFGIMNAVVMAIDYSNEDMIEYLIKNGADVEHNVDGETHLHRLAHGSIPGSTISIFVDAGANINASDNDGLRPYDIAKNRGRRDLMDLL